MSTLLDFDELLVVTAVSPTVEVGTDDIPRLRHPFAIENGRAAVVAQDSQREVQSVYALLATELGSRDELPEFGIPEHSTAWSSR